MSDQEWETLFDLLHKAIGLPLTAAEKGELVRAKAEEFDAGSDCIEFAGCFGE